MTSFVNLRSRLPNNAMLIFDREALFEGRAGLQALVLERERKVQQIKKEEKK